MPVTNHEPSDLSQVTRLFTRTRQTTIDLCQPLERDDYMVQATQDTSPPKWHLGHTTWFFDNFILRSFQKNYSPVDSKYNFIFNSYYNTVGEYVPKPSRATISRPSLEKVIEYRELVETSLLQLLEENAENQTEIMRRTILGINHEQQHQELLLMDIKRNYYALHNKPVYTDSTEIKGKNCDTKWISYNPGIQETGYDGNVFCFDNETPHHRELIHPFSISDRPVNNGEYLEFIQDGGYSKPDLWLSDGWSWKLKYSVEHPLYWEKEGNGYSIFTLNGFNDLDLIEPVSHISYYEADAFARWSGSRLPTEFQWEYAAGCNNSSFQSNYLELGHFRPVMLEESGNTVKGIGNTWEWTSSSYLPYPGYTPLPGSLGEYNGKFMSGQMVLRGASYGTPEGHSRKTYRNFYAPGSRWQFSGIRLSKDGLHE